MTLLLFCGFLKGRKLCNETYKETVPATIKFEIYILVTQCSHGPMYSWMIALNTV